MGGNVLDTPAPRFDAAVAARLLQQTWGLTGELRPLHSERDQNFRLRTSPGVDFLLRISNRAEDPDVVDFRIQAMLHVARCDPGLPVQRVIPNVHGGDRASLEDDDGIRHMAHLVSYLDGIILDDVPAPRAALQPLGAMQARLGRALRGFFHPAADHELFWDISRAAGLRPWLGDIAEPDQRDSAARALDRFEEFALPVLPTLRAQVIHGDATTDNVLVAREDPARVAGILDFGDMVHAALVNDLAVAIAHLTEDDPDPVGAAEKIIRGYAAVTPLEAIEIELLPDLVAARLAASLIIHAWRGPRQIGNRPADPPEQDAAIHLRLRRLLDTSRDELLRRFTAASRGALVSTARVPALLLRRERLLAPGYSLFYDRPLHIVRGEGVWLYDETGRACLDAYNNVAHVGHSHPRVVDAISRQAATLNTNTRYLHGLILDCAERITATLPQGLEVCTFVCTGSEANDLAWQMARAFTGHDGALVTDFSYHGNTTLVSRLSTEEYPPRGEQDFVRGISAPDAFRGYLRDKDAAAVRRLSADMVSAHIESLEQAGHGVAALLLDSMFVADGIFRAGPEYLAPLCERVRHAGGLFIADEVQGGFGRSGEWFWSFEQGDVVPDIVTMGKPMGNGHPVGLVVARRDVAAAFAGGPGYFNTFGGNPVACAAALAVLDVIEKEGLQENARTIGAYLKQGLAGLATRHECIGDIRGAGLCLGVDLVTDRTSRNGDQARARAVREGLRNKGILVGTAGKIGNVLKIRPPMVFTRDHADLFLSALDELLYEP